MVPALISETLEIASTVSTTVPDQKNMLPPAG